MIQNGEILGGMYQIIREIGRGGTGIIYLAEHLRLKKKVVVKKVKDHFVGQINGRAEVDILKRLHHTYLPQVYDFLVIGTSIYTVMEYVEGQDLQQYLDGGYHFQEQTLRRWLMQLCEVLEYLHTQTPPILHSDIKPSNIMITKDGNVCLIDFNISLDGEVSTDIKGVSPWYAAPEQYDKAQNILCGRKDAIVLDARMDIYSLGAVFYTMMTGLLPIPDKEQYQDIFSMNIPYSDGLRAIIAKAMRKKISVRFQSARQMNKVLQDVGRMDPLYRRYSNIQIGSTFVWLLFVIAGVLLLYYGNWQNGVEKWQQAYSQLYVAVESQEEPTVVSKATEMLNDYVYKGYLKRHEDKKAEVLHVLGESYFRQADFQEAAEYYEEAFELMPEEGSYCKDYVIALVRSEQMSKARRVMESAESVKNLSDGEKLLIQAEMSRMAEDYSRTLEELEALETMSVTGRDTDVLLQGYLLAASVYEAQEMFGEAVARLEQAEAVLQSKAAYSSNDVQNVKDVQRQMGQTSVKAASASTRTVNQNAYLQKALQCYESLNQSSNPSYEDRLNLALVERAMGNYIDSNESLKEMNQAYGEDYTIPMWMCYNYLDLAKEQGSYDGIWEELKFRYQDCRHRYSKSSGQSNPEMEALIEIMNELEG